MILLLECSGGTESERMQDTACIRRHALDKGSQPEKRGLLIAIQMDH